MALRAPRAVREEVRLLKRDFCKLPEAFLVSRNLLRTVKKLFRELSTEGQDYVA